MGKDIVGARPGALTFSWDPGQPLTAELLVTPQLRIEVIGDEPSVEILDVPGLRFEFDVDSNAGTVIRLENPPRTVVDLNDDERFYVTVYVTECFEGSRTIEITASGGFLDTFDQTILVPVRNTFEPTGPGGDPDPDPDPGDPPATITSNIAKINGLDTYVLNGVPYVFMTGVDSNGNGLSEVHDLATGAKEHAFETVVGRDGTVACTPDGTLFFTVLIDDGNGFVRFETFDAATDNAYVSPDFIAAQWIMGAAKLPFVPVLLDKKIFTAPGAEFERQFLVTRQAGKIDGIEIVSPWGPVDQTSATRAHNRAVAADGRGKDILSAHRNDTDGSTVIGRMKVGPTDNPAYFIEPIVTIPAVVDQLLPFGDSLVAWEAGQASGYLYRRDEDGDLTTADGTVVLPAGILDAVSGTMGEGETDRAYFLLPDKIVELSAPAIGPVTTRDIALPLATGAPIEFNFVDIGGKETVVILFEDGIKTFALDGS